ncbi:putative minor structural protein [Carnobacterium phage cd3]|uniref:Minor structural protein n=1 Tax=Carnobacterium phage cd2 TaxID=2849244 RepID=A0AAE7SW58_9CAUD|nr:putative minor structural protein [Carnobacterium phage cd2]QXP45150.1 putative minor structural protein [Carnobacterium phage cd2]QXP45294.1 putative minor structural protein [Carnobacterium phage cd3]
MIYIFDKSGVSIGQFENSVPNACPYLNDKFTENILTGEILLEFEVPLARDESQWLTGYNQVGYKDLDGDIRMFNIIDVYESYYQNEATKRVICEDVSVTELLNSFTKPYNALNLDDAMKSALETSGWSYQLDYNAFLEQDKMIINDTYINTRQAINNIAEAFGVAYKFTVGVNSLGVQNKMIRVLGKYEQNNGKYFTYDRDLVGIERSIDFTTVKTAVIALTKEVDGSVGTIAGFSPSPKVEGFTKELIWDFVVNDVAHSSYDKADEYAYLILDTGVADKQLAYLKACEELAKVALPTYTYKMDVQLLEKVANFEGERVRVGDIVWAKDKAGKQEIGLEARVVEIVSSHTDQSKQKLTFSNYREISVADSDDVKALREQLEKMQNDITNQAVKLNELTIAQEGIVTSLDGKSSISLGDTPKKNPSVGDTWLQPSKDAQGRPTVIIKSWNGTIWATQLDTAEINAIKDTAGIAKAEAVEAARKAGEASEQALENSRNFGNLLQNFTRDSKFDRWIPQPTETVKPYVKITSQTFQGMPTACLSFMGTQAPTSTNAQVYSDWIKVDPAKAYEFSVYMKTPSVTGMAGQDYIRLLTLNAENKPAITDFGNSYVQSVTVATATIADNQQAVDFVIENSSLHTDWKLFRGVIMPTGFNNLDMKGRGQNVTSNVRFKPQNRWMRVCFLANGQPGAKRDTHWANPIISEISSDATQYGSFIKQTVDGIQTTVNGKAEQSQVTQMAGQITSLVKTTDGHTSQITQLSTDINLKVSKGDVVNQINLSPDGILIAANKVQITGDTFIAKAVIEDANIVSVTADKLTAGTIDAGVIRVINLDAGQIKTGSLSAIDIVGSTITNSFNYNRGSGSELINFTGTTVLEKERIQIKSKRTWSTDFNTVTTTWDGAGISSTTFKSNGKIQGSWDLSDSGLRLQDQSGFVGTLNAKALSVTAWQNLTLSSIYTTAEGNTPQFRLIYQLDGSTIVKFRGQVKKKSGQFIANKADAFAFIHASMAPASNEFIQIASSASSGARCVVETNGNIQAMCASNADYIILSAITFILG